MDLALVAAVVVLALAFGWTNGFHDAANAIATSISTRALTPRVALALAAVFNLVGALLGERVALTISAGIVAPPDGRQGLVVVLSALVGAITWNLVTWWRGLPSSSSHALIGGLVGAGVASATQVQWGGLLERVVVWMVLAPLLGAALAFLAVLGLLWTFRNATPGRANRRFRMAQTVSAAAVALGHGLQDAQRTTGVIVLALVVADLHTGDGVPLWARIGAALAISAGTWAGGWRIMRTLGRRVVEVDPPRGFAAEAVTAGVLYATAAVVAAPVSTTHTITAAIAGAGATRRRSAVRWGVAADIVAAWLLTLPAAGLLAALCCLVGLALVS